MIDIVIPSRGRADAAKQVTLRLLNEANIKPFLVVPLNEAREYGKMLDHGRLTAELIGCEAEGISATRAWIFNHWRDECVMMLDDDMYFYYRPDMAETKLVRCKPKRLRKLFKAIGAALIRYPMIGLSARQGNNHVSEEFVVNTRAMNAYAFDVPKLMKAGVKFGRVPVMEDFDITLQLLRAGRENAVIYSYCWNQVGSNASGGCSSYRTAELQAKAAHKLKKLHPEFVTVVEKKPKVGWKNMETRTDVRIAWQKAARSSK